MREERAQSFLLCVTSLLRVFAFSSLLACHLATADTVAYWRFETDSPDQLISQQKRILDSSGNGNHLNVFSPDTSPKFTDQLPYAVVPQTRQPNRSAMDNSQNPGTGFPTRDLFTDGNATGLNLHSLEFKQWTIEASVLVKPVNRWETRWQTFLGRDGYNLPNNPATREDRLANLGFKKRGDNNRFSIEAWSTAGKYIVVQSKEPAKADIWYHLAAVSDGKTLSLYLKTDGDYVLQGQMEFDGALASSGETWTVGRGCFAFDPTEQFFGLVDEVRISNSALPVETLLASTGTAKPDAAVGAAPPPAPGAATTMPANLIHVHDPLLLKAGDAFHVFASHEGLLHYRSNDLLNWQRLPSIFTTAPDWTKKEIAQDPGLWAPDVAFFNGKYHLYYSASRFGSQRSAVGLMTNASLDPENPDYRWADEGKVVESFPRMEFNAIDPAVAFDAAGNPWLTWGSFNQGIYIQKIDPKTGKLDPSDPKPHHIAARPGDTALEAPHIFHRDGWYYLTVSYDFCCRGTRSTYKLVVGRSKNITGPYVDRDRQPMLQGNASLLLRSHDFHRGPGQSSIIMVGERTYLAHHYYDARQNGIPTLAVRELYWDEDGWPIAGEPIAELGNPVPGKPLAGEWAEYLDYGSSRPMTLNADGSIQGSPGIGTWTLKGNRLNLTWKTKQGQTITDDCFVSVDHNSFVGRRSDGSIVRVMRVERRGSR